MRRKVLEQYCGKEFTIINFKVKELLNPFTESRLENNVFFTELGCVLLEAVEKQVWIMGVAEDGTTVLIIHNWRALILEIMNMGNFIM